MKTLYEKLEKEINRPSSVVSLNEKISLIKKDIIENSKVITSSIIDNVSRITYPNYWLLQFKEMITVQFEKFFEYIIISSESDIVKFDINIYFRKNIYSSG